MKKTARYNYTLNKSIRCYVEADTAEQADKIFNTLVKNRADWFIADVKDSTPILEKFAEGMQKK